MDIDPFYEQVNYLTTALAAHVMIILDIMYHVFKSYKFARIVSSRGTLSDIGKKI